MEYEPDKRLIKSYVFHDGKCYFVSTIDRDSSSEQGGRFSETLVWAWDWEEQKRGEHILFSTGGAEGWIEPHLRLCRRIFDTGTFESPEEA